MISSGKTKYSCCPGAKERNQYKLCHCGQAINVIMINATVSCPSIAKRPLYSPPVLFAMMLATFASSVKLVCFDYFWPTAIVLQLVCPVDWLASTCMRQQWGLLGNTEEWFDFWSVEPDIIRSHLEQVWYSPLFWVWDCYPGMVFVPKGKGKGGSSTLLGA